MLLNHELQIVNSRPDAASEGAKRRAILLALLPCFAFSVLWGLRSDGCYHDDDLTHYLMARWSGWYPGYLLHIWGRPGFTIPMAAVAWIGDRFTAWHVARVLSAVVTAAGAYLAARLAMRLGIRRAWLVVPACYLQPLNAVLSYATLTENWTALYLIAALVLLERGRLIAAAAIFSLTLVTRHEMVVFLPLWWIALIVAQRGAGRALLAASVTLWSLVVHNVLFWRVFEDWPLLMYVQPHGSTEYQQAAMLSYLPHALYAVPPLLAGLAMMGGWTFLRRGSWVLPAFPVFFFVVHSLLRSMGLFASGGYGRFMAAMCPLIAILCVAGLERTMRRERESRLPVVLAALVAVAWMAIEIETASGRLHLGGGLIGGIRIAAAALLAAALAVSFGRRAAALLVFLAVLAAHWVLMVKPLRITAQQREVSALAARLRQVHLDREPLFATHPWLVFELGLVEDPRAHKGPRLLASLPIGAVVVWDSKYSENDFHGVRLAALEGDPAYESVELDETGKIPVDLRLKVFRKIGPTTALPDRPSEISYPPNLTSRGRPLLGIYYQREP